MFDQEHQQEDDNNNNGGWIASSESKWSWDENKQFERALLLVPEDCPDRWRQMAAYVPNKTADDVRLHYEALERDLFEIESGRVPLPNYSDDDDHQILFGCSSQVKERKKATPWTEQEHRLFLSGLHQYGKGDWRSISRNVVKTRTPTQVASHAQKYFQRQSTTSSKKVRKRSSIHDITTTADTTTVPPSRNQPTEEGPSRYQNSRFPMSRPRRNNLQS